MNIVPIVTGLILLVIAPILMMLSLTFAKRKIYFENKYHTLFWIGLVAGLSGLLLIFGKLLI